MNQATISQLAAQGFNHIPVYRRLLQALDVFAVFSAIAQRPYCYLFESGQAGGDNRWGRYSIIGINASEVIKVFDNDVQLWRDGVLTRTEYAKNPLDWIGHYQKQHQVPVIDDLPDFYGGLVGYFSYESVRYIEPKLKACCHKPGLGIADITLMRSDDLIVFDKKEQAIFLITYINPKKEDSSLAEKKLDDIAALLMTTQKQAKKTATQKQAKKTASDDAFTSTFGQEKYQAAVKRIKDYICQGDVMQVVPSQRLQRDFNGLSALMLYRALTEINPSPYMYYLHLDGLHIVGSSPEILVRIQGDKATVRPLAGTRKRGENEAEDQQLEKDLLADEKEIAEHLMLIDLGRNDLGRVAKTGSVVVNDQMTIERYSHVMHIVSNVECQLKKGVTAMDVFKATFPAGTLSGAPKVRAMEIINDLEPHKRHIYSGAVGYLAWHGNMDLAIAIRTAMIYKNKIYVQAGAGIVSDSVPEKEWQETLQKAGVIIKATEMI